MLRSLISVMLAAMVVSLPAVFAPAPALAAAPIVGGQAPGYYRMFVGRYEVTALLDGTHPFPAEELAINARPGEVKAALGRQDLASPVEGMINAFLINTGSKLILIDTGAGDLYGRDGGLLVANLRAAGYTPEQVDEIYLTHLHRDHVGGLVLGGKLVFPKAIIYVSKTEADFWLNNANRAKTPPLLYPMFDGAQSVLAPYIAEGRLRTFDSEAELSPGIHPIFSPGHAPGHCYYMIESGGQRLLAWGDTVHVQPVQFPRPAVGISYDTDARQAVASRQNILADAARKGYWIAGAQISFPGIGHVRADGSGGYTWVPANYTLNRFQFAPTLLPAP
jgi:glyoxylase-like metal-dependent hydrolase (beta-lactamase superfamily II)